MCRVTVQIKPAFLWALSQKFDGIFLCNEQGDPQRFDTEEHVISLSQKQKEIALLAVSSSCDNIIRTPFNNSGKKPAQIALPDVISDMLGQPLPDQAELVFEYF